tara:strand:- start:1174 stop:2730 length:1557 start_codon:yes stop_codon:yes gene_type:complete
MKTQNLRFGEAVKYLANLAGMQTYTFSKKDEERENQWKEYSEIFKIYVDFCHNELLKNNDLIFVKEYLKKRNLTKEEVVKFNIGYVQPNTSFVRELESRFNQKSLLETGLFYLDEKRKILIERFKERVVFPINSITGYPIALGGRKIKENNNFAKYINSPETPFFKKGSNLYNLDFARKFSNKIDYIYLVEGYMDVVSLSNKGIYNTVANLGTSLTEKQMSILNQFYDDIVICFDGDESGYKAALRAAESLIKELKPEKNISFLFLPDKEDPDSFVNKHGKDYFIDFTKTNKVLINNFIFQHYKNQTKDNPSSLAIFEKTVRSIANSIKDEFIKKYVLEDYLEKIHNLTPNTNDRKYKFKPKARSLKSTQKFFNETKNLSYIEIKEYSFLYIVLNNLTLLKENLNLIQNVKLFSTENKLIFESILGKLFKEKDITLEKLSLDQNIIEKITKFASIKYALKKIGENDEEKIELLQEIIRDIKNHELEIRIEELESKFSKDFNESTFNEIKELKKLQKIN